jgi:OOP family OmpA-OmpF porin
MRKLAIAVALASSALASPALARDGSFYVGLDGGGMVVEDMRVQITDNATNPLLKVDHHGGWDISANAGYDFGLIRAEGEIGYKRAGVLSFVTPFDKFEADGHSTALSGMLNALVDFGDENHLYGFVGAGIGVANVKNTIEAAAIPPYGVSRISGGTTSMAWQLLAGARWAMSPNIDLGFKYRYFDVPKLDADGDFALTAGTPPVTTIHSFGTRTHWKSHSLLLSLAYNLSAWSVQARTRCRPGVVGRFVQAVRSLAAVTKFIDRRSTWNRAPQRATVP